MCHRLWSRVIAALFLLGVFPGLLPAKEKVVLQLKWRHQFQFAGYYAAQELGYYAEAGLNVEIRPGTAGIDPVAEVTQGRATFGIGPSGILLKQRRGKNIVVLAAICQHSPYVILVPESSGIRSIHELAGKRIMLEPNSSEIEVFLRNEGVQSYRTVPLSYNPFDIVTGQADAMVIYTSVEPFVIAKLGFPVRRFLPKQGGTDFYNDCLFVSGETLKDNPELVQKFLDASLRGWRCAFKHSDKVIDIIVKKYNSQLSRAFLQHEMQELRKLILPDLIDIGHINPGRWRNIANTYVNLGLLPKDYSLENFLYPLLKADSLFPYRWFFMAAVALVLFFVWIVLPAALVNRQLHEGEARRQVLFDNSPLPLAWAHTDGRLEFINRRFVTFFGYSLDEIPTITSWAMQVIPDDADLETMHCLWKEAVRGSAGADGHGQSAELSVHCRDGVRREVVALVQQAGGLIILMFDDITERLQTEQALRLRITTLTGESGSDSVDAFSLFDVEELQAIQDLFSEATGLASIITTPEGVAITQPTKFCTLYNEVMRTSDQGWENYQLSNTLVGCYNPDGPNVQIDASGGLWEAGANMVVGGHHIANWFIGQVRCAEVDLKQMVAYAKKIDVDPARYLAALEQVPVMEEAHFRKVAEFLFRLAQNLSTKVYRNLQQARLIAELKKAHEQQKELQGQLVQSQKLESIGTMASGIAHEINNPLMSMINFSELIRDKLALLPEDEEGVVEQIKSFAGETIQEGERITTIVHSLLVFSRKNNESPVSEDMQKIIENLLPLLEGLLRKDEIIFSVDIEPDLPKVLCRPFQIQQVLLNLITNARDALSQRFPGADPDKKLEVIVSEVTKDGRSWVCTAVQDNGLGVPQEVQDRIFDPFFTTKEPGKGTGLGLSISYGIIREHGGYIELESLEGGPTAFRIWLLAKTDHEESLPPPPP